MEPVRGNYPLAFPFLSLPEKPLAEIIKFLKPDDLRNLRLVNHELLRLVDGKRDTIRLPRNEIEHEHDQEPIPFDVQHYFFSLDSAVRKLCQSSIP